MTGTRTIAEKSAALNTNCGSTFRTGFGAVLSRERGLRHGCIEHAGKPSVN